MWLSFGSLTSKISLDAEKKKKILLKCLYTNANKKIKNKKIQDTYTTGSIKILHHVQPQPRPWI